MAEKARADGGLSASPRDLPQQFGFFTDWGKPFPTIAFADTRGSVSVIESAAIFSSHDPKPARKNRLNKCLEGRNRS